MYMYENHERNNQFDENENYGRNNRLREDGSAAAYILPAASAEKREKKPKRRFMRLAALALCCALLCGAAGAGGVIYGLKHAQADGQTAAGSAVSIGKRPSTALNAAYINTEDEMTAAEIYAAYVNSTVGITTSVKTNYFGYQTTSAASGSGFILTSDGYIVTNYHVIEEASAISVTTCSNETYGAELVGCDESNDIAVLKIAAEGLSPVVIGDSSNLNVGDGVLAIGNPLGELTFSLTTGVVSALNREITLSSGVTMNLIQTDCAINSGNSGGALFNMYGEVIGITNAKYSSGSASGASIDNIGFAIPMSDILGNIESIIENGTFSAPYIGVSVGNISFGWFGAGSSVAIKSVSEGSPAAEAGLQQNDILIAVNGEAISRASDFERIILNSKIGLVLKLTLNRDGKDLEAEVTVGQQQRSALPGVSAGSTLIKT